MNFPSIAYYTIEEADARLVRHTLHLAATGYKNILVRTVDTDLLILLCAYGLYWMNDSSVNVCLFGAGSNTRYYNVREMSESIGREKCGGLPFLYAFSGCDMVSSCYKKWKMSIFAKKWHSMDDASLNKVFQSLSDSPAA